MHLDLANAISLAGLATAALHIERESSRFVAVDARFWEHGEQAADFIEYLDVGRGVAARSPADRSLIDVDHLVELLESVYGVMPTDSRRRVVEFSGERRVENVIYERRLSGTRNAGHGRHYAQG